MVELVKIKLWGNDVGAAYWDVNNGVANFEFEPAFLNLNLNISPIQMDIKKSRIFSFGTLNRETFYGLPGLLADSLPDTYGNMLLDKWLVAKMRLHIGALQRSHNSKLS